VRMTISKESSQVEAALANRRNAGGPWCLLRLDGTNTPHADSKHERTDEDTARPHSTGIERSVHRDLRR
jgi:hypothetical protein